MSVCRDCSSGLGGVRTPSMRSVAKLESSAMNKSFHEVILMNAIAEKVISHDILVCEENKARQQLHVIICDIQGYTPRYLRIHMIIQFILTGYEKIGGKQGKTPTETREVRALLLNEQLIDRRAATDRFENSWMHVYGISYLVLNCIHMKSIWWDL